MSNRTAQVHFVNSEQMRATQNSLPIDTRHHSIEALNRVVAHLVDVALAAKHAHWNVRGANFASYHALFDRVFKDLVDQVDHVGERASALGGIARGTVQTVASATQLQPYPVLMVAEREHISQLANRLGQVGREIRAAVGSIGGRDDIVTVDVLTETCATIDRLLWLIESHGIEA